MLWTVPLKCIRTCENWRKLRQNRGRYYRILISQQTDLSFPTANDCAKFHQILFKIAIVGAMTDRQTQRQADTRQRS